MCDQQRLRTACQNATLLENKYPGSVIVKVLSCSFAKAVPNLDQIVHGCFPTQSRWFYFLDLDAGKSFGRHKNGKQFGI